MAPVTGTPAWVRTADDLRRQIADGTLGPGAQLPSMSQLCEQYGVSNTVIRAALNQLRAEGVVVGQQGVGVFVQDDAAARIGAGEAGTSSDFQAIMRHLDGIRAEVAALKQRVDELERRPAPRGGRSAR